MLKVIVVYILAVILCVILLPAAVSRLLGRFNEGYSITNEQPARPAQPNEAEQAFQLSGIIFQYYTAYERLALFDELEEYIVMVVAAEMPALFHIDALKAQAVAARTYAVHQLIENPGMPLYDIYQAFATKESLRELWGDRFDYFMARIRMSVETTRGEIMMYNGVPILAVFHAMSAGQTELAENVWRRPRPYLISVFSCDYDGINGFEVETIIHVATVARSLGGSENDRFVITQISNAGYVLEVTFGNQTFTGREVRERLGLRSTNFNVTHAANGDAIFITRGHGHGVGMSQHGANNRALRGANYIEILTHYFHNVSFGFLQ